MKKGFVVLFAAAAFSSGCSTAVTHLGAVNPQEKHPLPIYSGVHMDTRLLTKTEDPKPNGNRLFIVGYSIMDIPFSAIGDTLLIPVDLAMAH